MAPRRGGGSGSSSSINNQCSDYDAFEDDYSKAQVGLLGGFLFLFLVLAYCVASKSGKRKKAGKEKSIVRWYQFGIALFLLIALFILMIVRLVLVECRVLFGYSDEETAIGFTTEVVNDFMELFMMGLVLFVITKRLFQLAGSTALKRTFLILDGIFFGIVSIIFVTYIILAGLLTYNVGEVRSTEIIRAYSRLAQAYVILYALLAVFAVIGLIIAAIRVKSKPERRQGVLGWVPVLVICLLGYSIYRAVIVFLIYYDQGSVTPVSGLVGYGISLLFLFGTFFSMFMISRGQGWEFLRLPQEVSYNFAAPPPTTMPYNGQTPYDTMQSPTGQDKRASYLSQGTSATPVPPYMGNSPGMAYSGNGVYEPQGQSYNSGTWGSSGYAPVHQMPTAYNAPMGAASRDPEYNELTGRR